MLQVEVDGIAFADGVVSGTFVDERVAADDVAGFAFGDVVFDHAEARADSNDFARAEELVGVARLDITVEEFIDGLWWTFG